MELDERGQRGHRKSTRWPVLGTSRESNSIHKLIMALANIFKLNLLALHCY
jgi:hypothetical protein